MASSTAWLPQETTVCRRSPRREASALTATLPDCEISATGPGSRGTIVSPQSATRSGSETIPLPFGPHTGSPSAAAASAACRSPSRASANPAAKTTAPPQPSPRAAATTAGASAAGIATTTASGASGRSSSDGYARTPCTLARRGLTA